MQTQSHRSTAGGGACSRRRGAVTRRRPASRQPRSRSATSIRTAARLRPTAPSARPSRAYFKKLNEEGGVNGRKINFITYDDSYSPPKTVEMARKLVEQDQVLRSSSRSARRRTRAIHKYMNQQKVPHLFVATGATKWNDPKNFPWTMGWQPNYQTEGRIYAAYVLKNVKPNAKIGILYQNDDYGKDYLKGFEDGLGKANAKLIVMKQSYEVTDPTVDSQMVQPEEQRRQHVLQHHDAEVRGAGDHASRTTSAGSRCTSSTTVSGSVGSVLKPAGAGRLRRHHHHAVPQGPDRSGVDERSGDEGVARVHEEVLSGGQPHRHVQRLRRAGRADDGAGAQAGGQGPVARRTS